MEYLSIMPKLLSNHHHPLARTPAIRAAPQPSVRCIKLFCFIQPGHAATELPSDSYKANSVLHHLEVSTELVGNLQYGL